MASRRLTTPYAYRPGRTALHRLPGGVKLLGLLFFSVIPVSPLFPAPGRLAVVALLLIAGSRAAKIRPWELLRGSAPITVMALLVIAFRSFRFDRERGGFTPDYHGFTAGLFFGAGLVLSFAVGALFFSVTTMTELRRSLDALPAAPRRLFSRLTGSRLKPPEAGWSRLGLGISLMLGFLPRFFEIWEEARAAYQARGGGKAGHFRLIPLVTVRMVELAAETALALESRSLFSAASGGFKQRPAKRL